MVFAFTLVDKPGLIFDFDTKVKVNQFVRKIGFQIKNETEGQCESNPQLMDIITVLRCIFSSNLEILAWIGGELMREQILGQIW